MVAMRAIARLALPLLPLLLSAVPGGAAPPAPTPTPAPRHVLVSAEGARTEVEAFVSRFFSEVSDRSEISIADARLSGATLTDLTSDKDGEVAKSFRAAWPAEVYLGVTMPVCTAKSRRSTLDMGIDQSTGRRDTRQVISYETECTPTVRVIGPDGNAIATVTVSGRDTKQLEETEDVAAAMEGAAQNAAEKAAKKLFPKKKK